jgi:hypothetical protein
MEEIGFRMVAEPYTEKYRPTAAQLDEAAEWGRGVARAVKSAS